MMRRLLVTGMVAMLLGAVVLPLWAAETAEIALGGGLVARIRDKGEFSSVGQRAAHIEQQITQVISTKDTLRPVISLKLNKKSLWSIYAWDIELMSVYPAEAKASGMSDKQMGAAWAKNFERQFPLATPCSKLPPEMLGYGKPGAKPAAAKPVAAKPASTGPKPVAQAPKPAPKPVVQAPKPAAVASPSAPKPKAEATAPVGAVAANPSPLASTEALASSESGALLLIVDTLRTARGLDEQGWTGQKETLARSLYSDLAYYLTGKGTPPALPITPGVAKPTTKPVVKPTAPVAKPTAPVAKPTAPVAKPTAPVAKPAAPVAKPAAKPVVPAPKPVVKPAPAAPKPAVDPSMVRVPQKNRIRAKFGVVKPAYDKFAASDPAAAAPVGQLLADSRQAFARGDFDTSERLVDEALKALSVEFKE